MAMRKKCFPVGVWLRGKVYWIDVTIRGRRHRYAAGPSVDDAIQLVARLKAAAGLPKQRKPRPPYSCVPSSVHKRLEARQAPARQRAIDEAEEATFATLHRKRLPPSPKFEQIAVRYLAKSKLVNKPQSYKCARVSLRRLRAFFGPRTIDSLKAADLRRYMEKRLLTVTPAFVNRDLRYLKAVLRFAIDEGVIGKLPFKIQLLRTTKRLPTFLSESELTRLFAHASERIRPMLMTAAMTGLRAGELRALEWCDVDLEMRVLRVCAKVEIEFSPKSHAEREVPLNGQLVAILKAHRETLLIADGRAPVFQRNPQTGSRWDDSGQLREVRQAFIDAGLYNRDSRPGLHMLRRSFASHALKFTDIETVRELGGWSELGVVQRYVASSGPRKRAAVERLVFDERDD